MKRRFKGRKAAAFLAAYAKTCSVTISARAAKCLRSDHYNWLRFDPAYKAAFEELHEEAAQILEDEAVRRALEGVEKPITVAGEREVIREYSDTLLIFMLKGMKPAKFRERHEHTIETGEKLSAILRQRFEKRQLPVIDVPLAIEAPKDESSEPEK